MWFGFIALALIWLIYLIAIHGLAKYFEFELIGQVLAQPYIHKLLKFTLIQASLSTLISISLAVLVARAIHRRSFIGKQLLLSVASVCLVLPVIVAVLGIVVVHGGKGWIASLLAEQTRYLYSLAGILIAHVFFNLPLALRVFINSLNTVAPVSWRLAGHLGLSSWQSFKLLEWPALRQQLPATAGLIFLLCFTSFAVVLVFGGGLKYASLEVAIYQAIRFEFDIPSAVALAILQITVCGVLYLTLIRFGQSFNLQGVSAAKVQRFDGNDWLSKTIDVISLLVFGVWVVLPIIAIAVRAFNAQGWQVILTQSFYSALLGSALISAASVIIGALLTVALGYLIKSFTHGARKSKKFNSLVEISIQLNLIFPAFVLATGLFIGFKANLKLAGPVIVLIINVLAILPFMLRFYLPAVLSTYLQDRLCQSLGLSGFKRFKLVDWPVVRKAFAWSVGVGLALSLGDFSVIALFGNQDFVTLPLYLYRLLGAYKIDQAAVIGFLICLLCLLMFGLSQRFIGGKRAH